ncbi:hypothetical protein AB5Q52_000524 [Vibrio cholerae]
MDMTTYCEIIFFSDSADEANKKEDDDRNALTVIIEDYGSGKTELLIDEYN